MSTLAELAARRYTQEFSTLALRDLPNKATLVFAKQSTEERGRHPIWDEAIKSRPNDCIEIDSGTNAKSYELSAMSNGSATTCSLRNDGQLRKLFGTRANVVVDISGLPHPIWAALLRALRSQPNCGLHMLYVEPGRYRSHPTPATLGSFDLTTSFEGIRPLPGYARLARANDSERRVFVPLLGFEGARPRFIHSELDPSIVVPVVGLPGFRVEFPSVAVACNQEYLTESSRFAKTRVARGACPFDIVSVLREVAKDEGAHHLQIAPIGTKPHALGAFLYVLLNQANSEIVYDHPVRRPSRTEGIGVSHLYDVSAFLAAA